MNRANTFPIPFKSLRTITGGRTGPYVVGAMFTAAYSEKAERLAASCEKFELPYDIHEVPTVHRSISGQGTDDLTYTKANFIRHLLALHKKPILYLDVDCELMSQPDLIDQLVRSGCDFAIYNGYADEYYRERFLPMEISLRPDEPPIKDRFYRFLASAGWYTNSQLVCYGLAQFYGNSVSARALLSRWHRTIVDFPGCPDDECLNFVFNNLTKRSWLSWLLKVRWLPMSYARISWWIHAKPVIKHRDLPGGFSSFIPIKDPKGRKQYYRSQMEWRNPVWHFPPGCIIDTEQHMVCKLVNGQIVPLAPTDQSFWL